VVETTRSCGMRVAARLAGSGALVPPGGLGPAHRTCGGAANGRPTPPNHAVERTGHSGHRGVGVGWSGVARRSPPALAD
jgi:hypothetical protein